jgi:hypothetical protein
MSLLTALDTGSIELITSYVSGSGSVESQAFDNWVTIGGCFKADSEMQIRIEVIGMITNVGVTGYARLYDFTQGQFANRAFGNVVFDSGETPLSRTSGRFSVLGGHIYGAQIRCSGTAGLGLFVVSNVIPKNA